MKRKRVRLKYRKERAVLSDVLPYEVPLTLSNSHFYKFLIQNKLEFKQRVISWKRSDDATDSIVKLLIGAGAGASVSTQAVSLNGSTYDQNCLQVKSTGTFSTPFTFKIRHKKDELRELTICHPRTQLQLVELYDDYKELILSLCRTSPFSVRRPTKISRFSYHLDSLHYKMLSEDAVGVEEQDKEYENVRSFFVYKDYSHIFKFYEDYRFHRCEKKYDKLLKLDITKCFDSIYTHSLPWALYGKETVKDIFVNTKQKSRLDYTFGDKFDRLMQAMNQGETHGIIIGPEFSRIFAELILQKIDKIVNADLESDQSLPCKHKVDYEMFRYVDDYFIFYNDERMREKIVERLQLRLKDYKLHLNMNKAELHEKPIITNISMAKHRIAKLLEETLTFRSVDNTPATPNTDGPGTVAAPAPRTIEINSRALITQFKTILKEFSVTYKDTLNYTLAILERRSVKIIAEYESRPKSAKSEKAICEAILRIFDFAFFIYAVSPRVNTTIRLCRALYVFTSFLKRKETNPDNRHSVFKLVADSIHLVLQKNATAEHTPVETLYLLIALRDLGKDYLLGIDQLCRYFKIDNKSDPTQFNFHSRLDYISTVVLIFYTRNRKEYAPLLRAIEGDVIGRFSKKKVSIGNDTELILLLFDFISCPYVSALTKTALLTTCGVTDPALQQRIITKQKHWFTKWSEFDFGSALDAKQSREVY